MHFRATWMHPSCQAIYTVWAIVKDLRRATVYYVLWWTRLRLRPDESLPGSDTWGGLYTKVNPPLQNALLASLCQHVWIRVRVWHFSGAAPSNHKRAQYWVHSLRLFVSIFLKMSARVSYPFRVDRQTNEPSKKWGWSRHVLPLQRYGNSHPVIHKVTSNINSCQS